MAVGVSVSALLDDPCPRVGVTITGLGTSSESVVSVWRVAEGERNPVRGARRTTMTDSSYVVDFDAPLGRPITYEVEVISGPSGARRVTSSAVTVASDTGWIMDPLVPQTAVQVSRRMVPGGEIVFAVSAMAKLDYVADAQVFKILGSDRPMALFGQRMAAAGVDFSLITNAADQNTRLANLLKSTAQLLVRVPASWTTAIPGSCFTLVGSVSEVPVEASVGGTLSSWSLTGDTVAAPTIKVLTATFTYGDVELLLSTYGQKESLMAGKKYLDDLKNPVGG